MKAFKLLFVIIAIFELFGCTAKTNDRSTDLLRGQSAAIITSSKTQHSISREGLINSLKENYYNKKIALVIGNNDYKSVSYTHLTLPTKRIV